MAFAAFNATFVETVQGFSEQKLGGGLSIVDIASRSLFVQTPALDDTLWDVGGGIGLDLATMKYLLCLVLAYPFSLVFRMIPSPTLKNLYSLILGVVFMQWIYGTDWMHSFVSVFVNYLICILAPRKHVGKLCMLWAMGYMTFSHFYRMSICYSYTCQTFKKVSGFDFTGTQMVLTMKLSSFGFNYSDAIAGNDKDKVAKSSSSSTPLSAKDEAKEKLQKRIMSERKEKAIETMPSFVQYFGYMYCFTCLLAGPAFEYRDYIDAVDGTAFKKGDNKQGIPKSSFFAAFKNFGVSILCLVVNLVLGTFFPIKMFFDYSKLPSFIFVTEGMKSNMFLRFACSWIALVGERCKFYFAWKCAEGSSVLAGFGFEGYTDDGKEKGWSGVENIDIINFEKADNLTSATKFWNKRTQQWLQKYTYFRCNQSLFILYFVSALWHGLYPGFFAFFLSAPIFTVIDRSVKEKINPIFEIQVDSKVADSKINQKKEKTYPMWYNGVCWLLTSIALNYIVQFFSANTTERVVFISNSYKHLPHYIAIAVMVALQLFPKSKKSDPTSKATK